MSSGALATWVEHAVSQSESDRIRLRPLFPILSRNGRTNVDKVPERCILRSNALLSALDLSCWSEYRPNHVRRFGADLLGNCCAQFHSEAHLGCLFERDVLRKHA